MEPSAASADIQGESKERKKIHFADPSSAPNQLDPRQVEMIRRRRPTPATLFRVADQSSPEDDQSTHQWVVGENGVLKPKRVNPNVYQPPSLRAVQKMAEAQMQHLGIYPPLEDFEGEEYEDYHWQGEEDEEEEEEEEERSPAGERATLPTGPRTPATTRTTPPHPHCDVSTRSRATPIRASANIKSSQRTHVRFRASLCSHSAAAVIGSHARAAAQVALLSAGPSSCGLRGNVSPSSGQVEGESSTASTDGADVMSALVLAPPDLSERAH